MKRILPMLAILIWGFSFALFLGCENNYPDSIWDPNKPSLPQPVIESIIPPDSAYAGVGEIIIKGRNFSAVPEQNLVFFSGNRAEVISATTTEIRVKSPNVVGSDIEIKIAVQGAELFSEPVKYKLKAAVAVFGKLQETDMAIAVAADRQGNVYVDLDGKVIKKISKSGETTHFADVSFLRANGMKMGPNNTLYVAFAAGRLRKIGTIDQNGQEGTFVTMPGKPLDLDFDSNGNLWVGVDKNIYVVKPDKSMSKVLSLPLTMQTLRVYDRHLYFSGLDIATGEEKIWKAAINGETLDTEELVLDVRTASWLEGAFVYTFTFSLDGEMYLATDHSDDAIFVFNPADGSHQVLFSGLISPTIRYFTWHGPYLYAVQQLENSSNILRIDLGKEGAPYFGRQ